MDKLSAVKRIGLDEKQAQVYLKALELGEASMTELAKRAEVKRPTAYLAVERLLVLGLLSETKKGKRKVYSAVHPRRLPDLARLRAQEVEEALPELLALYSSPKERPKIQVFDGVQGVELVYRDLYASLGRNDEALFVADIAFLQERFPVALSSYKKVMRTLKRPRVRELNISNDAGRTWARDMTHLMRGNPHYGHRLLPETFQFGATDTMIFGSTVAIFCFSKDVFVITIESAEITKTLRVLFEWAWMQGKELK